MKTDIIKSDFEALLSSASNHPSAKLVATVAETIYILVSVVGYTCSSRSWYARNAWPANFGKRAQSQNFLRLLMSIMWCFPE